MSLFPAILVGGPPHSGKSVLTHSLSMQLRKRNIAHYALRAAPDGEGDWSNETDWPLVEQIRRKGQWTSRWVSEVCGAIGRRHLPLLVDMGGRPTPEQEVIFDQCNYVILLTPSEREHEHWLALTYAHNLSVIADLRSDLHGSNQWVEDSDPITGTLAGLNRNCMAGGPAFDALVERVAAIMHFTPTELWQTHRSMATWTTHTHVLNFDEQSKSDADIHGAGRFNDADINDILNRLPKGEPVCLYGRAPATAIAAVAHAHRVRWLFDVRLGWVQPPELRMKKNPGKRPEASSPVAITIERAASSSRPLHSVLHIAVTSPPLGIDEASNIVLPHVPAQSEVLIDGIIPNWLIVAIAHAYRHCASITVYQPRQTKSQAAADTAAADICVMALSFGAQDVRRMDRGA